MADKSNHQSSVVEIEGKINNTQISILINLRATLSYITSSVVESNKLNKMRHAKSWLVQLATRAKRNVVDLFLIMRSVQMIKT
jgi:hypothetical protein